jgi:hypothetical protein
MFDPIGDKLCEAALLDRNEGVRLSDCKPAEEQGKKSYVFFLPDQSNPNNSDVFKVPRPNQPTAGDPPQTFMQREIENMSDFDLLGLTSVDYPRLVTHAVDGSWLQMTRMGPALCAHWKKEKKEVSPSEAHRLGEQVGTFVAEIYQKSEERHGKGNGKVHKDLHFANMTLQPDGRIGVIDFDDFGKGDPHEAFIKLMHQKPRV